MNQDQQTENAFSTNPFKGEKTLQRIKDVGKFVAEASPVLGDAIAAKEIWDESQKPDPNWAYVGALGGAAVIGMIPGVGDAAAKFIKEGAKKALDIGNRIEVDPSVLGSTGGNIRLKPKEFKASDIVNDTPENAQDILGITEEMKEEWRKTKPKNKQVRTPELQQAIQAMLDNEITYDEYLELADAFRPIKPIKEVPEVPTEMDIVSSLKPDQVKKGIIGVSKEIKDGTRVASRLDINAYESFDTWVVSLHDGAGDSLSGASVGHGQVAVLENVNFKSIAKAGANIGSGKNKATIARIFGDYKNSDPQEVYERALKLINDPTGEWMQVGMNPFRHSYFYDKADGLPVTSAEEVIQIGPLVLAKKVKKVARDDPMFAINPKDPTDRRRYGSGGFVSPPEDTMDKITEHHYKNIAQGKTVDNPDGTLSTVRTATIEYDGITYLIPTVWDGKILDLEDAEKRAFAEDVYETFSSEKEAQEFDNAIHENFFNTTSPEEAEMAISKSDARKGIKTIEGEVMAEKKFQLDESKADLNKDGEISSYEQVRGEAIQKVAKDKELDAGGVEMYAGGLMTDSMGCGCGGSMCTCGMGVTVGYDEESGNPIPAGSSAENVKDDISAALSTGEYVLPADVVRWHGLKHIQYMMDEAKMGLMSMHSEGQIADIDTDDTEEDEEEDIETPEGNEVEVAEVDVEIEEMELDEEDEDDEDYSKKPSLPGYTSTPTVVYMKS